MEEAGDNKTRVQDNTRSVSKRWWIPIFLLAIHFPVGVVLVLLLSGLVNYPVMEGGSPYQYIVYFIIISGWLLTLISPVAVYFDRKYLTNTSDWTPSKLYFLMVLPFLANIILPVIYVYNRHKYVGTP